MTNSIFQPCSAETVRIKNLHLGGLHLVVAQDQKKEDTFQKEAEGIRERMTMVQSSGVHCARGRGWGTAGEASRQVSWVVVGGEVTLDLIDGQPWLSLIS